MKSVEKMKKFLLQENEYFKSMEKRQRYLQSMEDCLRSPFGGMLLKAIEDMESNAYAKLYESRLPHKLRQARAEIKFCREIKGMFMNIIGEKKALEEAIAQYLEEEGLTNNEK